MSAGSRSAGSSRSRRKRRSPEEMIADLEAEIDRVKSRQVTRQLKTSPGHKAALSALRALDRARGAAESEDLGGLCALLDEARGALTAYLSERGLKLPRASGRKAKASKGTKAGAHEKAD